MNKKMKLLSVLGLVTAILFLFSPMVTAQSLSISGKVIDKNSQEPVIGASVLIEGTSNGTITDLDGNFMLSNVPSKGNLVVSYIGYATQTLPINGKTSFSIVLAEDTETLDEVVVVGYGVQKKVNLTGSVASVKGDALEHRPVVDATQSLQGLVPGLSVSNGGSGRPGATGSLSLRGQGNLSGNSAPYVLVDGVEMSLSDVNPNDIENISVLKDAAACAIYGARAAYGVILVTTKQGEEGKMRASYQGTLGWSAPTVLPDMVNSLDFVKFWNDGVSNTGAANRMYSEQKIADLEQYMRDPSSIDPWGDLAPGESLNAAFENSERGLGNTDYFDLHYKNYSFKHNHNLSFSGGSKKAQYYVSGGYYNEDGILRYADMDYTRYTVNANITSELTKWLKLKFNTKFMHSDNRTPFNNEDPKTGLDGGLSEGFYHSLARFRPTVSVIDPNGHFTELSMIPYLQSGTYTDTQRDRFNITAGFELQPLKDWFIFFDYTYKQMNLEYEALNVAPSIYEQDGVTMTKVARSELGVVEDGKFTRTYGRTRYQTINLYTNYQFTLNDHHNFTLMGGYQEEDNDYSYMKNSITGLYSTNNPNLGMGTGDKVVVDTRNGWATRGFFGRINYDYDGRYLLELNGRYDGTSRFPKNKRYGFFPSGSVAWRVDVEPFFEPLRSLFSQFKIRASYGSLGNQLVTEYGYIPSMNSSLGSYLIDGKLQQTVTAPGLVSPDYTWEQVRTLNGGIDLALWNNKLVVSFDIYRRDTKGMLTLGKELPGVLGKTEPKENAADLKTRGWELSVAYRDEFQLKGKPLNWGARFVLSDNRSWITKFDNPTKNLSQYYEGQELGEIWGLQSDGLFKSKEEIAALDETEIIPWGALEIVEGWPKYKDLDGDQRITKGTTVDKPGDLSVIGNSSPRFRFGLNLNAEWNGFDVSAFLHGIGKRDYYPVSYLYWSFYQQPYTGGQVHAFDFYRPTTDSDVEMAKHSQSYINAGLANQNLDSKYPVFQSWLADKNLGTGINGMGLAIPQTNYMLNGSYLRIKNITIGYTLPARWTKKTHLNRVRIYVSGDNLFEWSGLKKYFDPEAVTNSDSYGYVYPFNRQYSFGINVTL